MYMLYFKAVNLIGSVNQKIIIYLVLSIFFSTTIYIVLLL